MASPIFPSHTEVRLVPVVEKDEGNDTRLAMGTERSVLDDVEDRREPSLMLLNSGCQPA